MGQDGSWEKRRHVYVWETCESDGRFMPTRRRFDALLTNMQSRRSSDYCVRSITVHYSAWVIKRKHEKQQFKNTFIRRQVVIILQLVVVYSAVSLARWRPL